MVSFWNPEQIDVAADECQSFALDNGAFSAWKLGNPVADWSQYYDWVKQWKNHPGFDFAIIPDVIDGSEADNDRLIHEWPLSNLIGVPAWHMHEPLSRLQDLIKAFRRVAIGSSGEYATVGNSKWWDRMSEAMDTACTDEGVPRAKLHGLRMLNPRIFWRTPLLFGRFDEYRTKYKTRSEVERNIRPCLEGNQESCSRRQNRAAELRAILGEKVPTSKILTD